MTMPTLTHRCNIPFWSELHTSPGALPTCSGRAHRLPAGTEVTPILVVKATGRGLYRAIVDGAPVYAWLEPFMVTKGGE